MKTAGKSLHLQQCSASLHQLFLGHMHSRSTNDGQVCFFQTWGLLICCCMSGVSCNCCNCGGATLLAPPNE
ncbi:hypothetical protein XENTR_v10008726 [Xenopus tropicalis]|nr:hypothetical protein XENTR_v10008726 [Xenopus tropicalis]